LLDGDRGMMQEDVREGLSPKGLLSLLQARGTLDEGSLDQELLDLAQRDERALGRP
jgi:hypothetical protein